MLCSVVGGVDSGTTVIIGEEAHRMIIIVSVPVRAKPEEK